MTPILCQDMRRAEAWSDASDRVELTYDGRFLRRKVLTTAGGLPFLVDLAQTPSLDHGDAFVLADGRVVEVVAADEDGTVVVLLDGSHSYDEDGEIVKHVWRDENNRVLGEVAQVKVKLARGNHTFTLTVTDNDGASTGDTVTVQVQ